MKLIEAMKKGKDLQRKADDLRGKVAQNCALFDHETPTYENQSQQIAEWLQAHSDLMKEILRLRIAVMKTNLATSVTIELGNAQVIKTIAEWIHRRKELAGFEMQMWRGLTDRGLREGTVKQSSGVEKEVKIVRYYSPKERDNKVELYRSEPATIDSTLEVINATTDLIEG